MGFFRLLSELLGLTSSPEQDTGMRQIEDDQYDDLIRQQHEEELRQDTNCHDND